MTTKSNRLGLTVAAIALLFTTTGCGGPQYGDVTGTITMNGKPVVCGTVTFIGADGNTKSSTITETGAYTVQGIVAGTATIVVDSPKPTTVVAAPVGRDGSGGRRREVDPNLPPDAPRVERPQDTPNSVPDDVAKKWFPIPREFADNTKAKLKFEVQPGANRHEIVLK